MGSRAMYILFRKKVWEHACLGGPSSEQRRLEVGFNDFMEWRLRSWAFSSATCTIDEISMASEMFNLAAYYDLGPV
jgi:hypothetical protein